MTSGSLVTMGNVHRPRHQPNQQNVRNSTSRVGRAGQNTTEIQLDEPQLRCMKFLHLPNELKRITKNLSKQANLPPQIFTHQQIKTHPLLGWTFGENLFFTHLFRQSRTRSQCNRPKNQTTGDGGWFGNVLPILPGGGAYWTGMDSTVTLVLRPSLTSKPCWTALIASDRCCITKTGFG